MEPMFGGIVADILIFGLCGLLGGFGLGLLHESGIELPRRRRKREDDNSETYYLDFGFLADMFIGALAAVVTYALNPPATSTQLIGASLVAGLGGAGILKGYIEARRNQALTQIANEALDLADAGIPGAPKPQRPAGATSPASSPAPTSPAAPPSAAAPSASVSGLDAPVTPSLMRERDARIRTLRSQLREVSK